MTRPGFQRLPLLIACLLVLSASEAPAQSGAAPDMLIVTPSTHDEMKQFRARDKFSEDPDTGYPGMPNQGIARKLNRAMNASLDILMAVAQEQRSRSAVLDRVRGFLATTRTLGLGEAENDRIIWCYAEACAIFAITIDLRTLESWLFGPGPSR